MEETFEKIKSVIDKSQNITLISSPEREKDSFPATLALFYSLKKIGKNVNLINNDFPKKYNFLIKRGVFRFSKADFLISIKGQGLKLSHLFYEKTKDGLNLYLKTNGGKLKQENIFFNPLSSQNLLITIGIKSFDDIKKISKKENLDFIININNELENQDFGQVKLIKTDYSSLSEIIFDFLKLMGRNSFNLDVVNSLLAGIIQGNSNFQDNRLSPKTFQKISSLIEKGADFQKIISELCQMEEKSSIRIFKRVLNKINFSTEQKLGWLIIENDDFQKTNSAPSDLSFTLERLASPIFSFSNFLCLWQKTTSPAFVQGIFYSPKKELLKIIEDYFQGSKKGNGFLFQTAEKSPQKVKDEIMNLVGNLKS